RGRLHDGRAAPGSHSGRARRRPLCDRVSPVVSGILPIDKGAGVTSHDVVVAVRRHLQAARVGHGGTLDPAAIGVLLILIGEATKLMPYVSDPPKGYMVTVRFGVTTDTHDLDGR